MKTVTTEREAHDEILRLCRQRYPGPVMREHGGVYRVVDVNRSEPDPDAKYKWQRRSILYASGDSWLACYGRLPQEWLEVTR